MPQTIQGGTLIGTSGNDDLRTLYYDSATETTTIYSALSGLGGDDALYNNGKVDNVTLDGGADNDRIYNALNGGQSPSIIGGAGNDYIQNGYATNQLKANNATIDAGAGSDTVDNYGDNALITLGDGDDSLYNVGDKATISAGAGADNVSHFGDNSSIDGGIGNDWLEAWGSNVTVNGDTGNDTLRGGGGNEQDRVSNVLFEDTIGNNRFNLYYTTNGTINAGTGDDTVYNDSSYNKKILINVGAGNNSVYAWYDSDVTIQAQGGNDSLYLQDSSNMSIDAGDGANNIDIDNLNASTLSGYTINAGTGNDTVHVYRGHRALISTGGGDDSINNVGHNSTINGGDGDDWINNHGGGRDYDVNSTMSSNNLIDGGKGNDSITNGCDNVTINGGDNDDYISSAGVDKVLINGGDGNDTIENIGNINREVSTNSTLNGGAGDDYIYNLGNKVTIDGGAGNDTISLQTGRGPGYTYSGSENVLINYVSGDGNDLIQFFNATTTLSVGGGNYSSVISGEDVILTVGNGKITLASAASLDTLNIIGTNTTSGVNVTNTVDGAVITGTAYADTINNSGERVTINALASDDFITNDVDSSVTTASLGNSINAGDGNDTIYNHHSYNPTLIGGAGNDSIVISRGHRTFVDGGAGNDSIIGQLTGTHSNDWTTGGYATIDGGAGNDYIAPGYTNNSSINGGAGNDTIITNGQSTTVDGGDGNNLIQLTTTEGGETGQFIVFNGNTTVKGFATGWGEGSDTIYNKIGSDPGVDFKSDGLTFYDGSDTLTLPDVTTTTKINVYYEASNSTGLNVYIAQNDWYEVSNSDLNTGEAIFFVGTSATHNHGVDFSNVSQDLNVTLDTEYEIPNNTIWINNVYSIRGGAGNTTIIGTTDSDTILTGGGAMTVDAGEANDIISLNGSAGNNLIKYTSGDGSDYITGFAASDTLSISGNIYSSANSGNDVIVTVGDSNITLSGAASLGTINIAGPSQGNLETAASLVGAMLYRTEEGYPVIAGLAFHPEEYHGGEPTNYASKETWTIKSARAIESADGLELQGIHYTPENSNDKWVVIVHGYGHNYKHMYPFAGFFLDNGYNVLMVDQRAAGDSEGTWLTMGTAESADIALWTQEIARRNPNSKITLFGVSMGAATAMLAAARDDIVNVTSLVEDCGYSNVVDIINLFNTVLLHQEQETVDLMMPVSESLTGYNLKDAAPINSISAAKMPTLFITGSEDSVVGGYMLSDLYEASGAEVKEQFIVQGATHGMAGMYDPVGYSNTTFRFLAEANGEGWETENVVDDISLRGTKYNDTITNSGDNVTINAVGGDDSITNSGENLLLNYASGDGNDYISGFNADDTLSISGDAYSTLASGNDLIVSVGDDKITLQGAATLSTVNIIGTYTTTTSGLNTYNTVDGAFITGTAYNDIIINSGTRVTIEALEGDDYIANVVDSSVTTASLGNSINAGDGNDTIFNYHTYNPTLIGGAGNDFIVVSNGHKTFIDGGDGNDTIGGEIPSIHADDWHMGGYATIDGGAGDDYITPGYTNNSSINGGDGNDTIITNGKYATVDGGDGNNLIQLTTTEGGQTGQFIVFNGNTTVENFGTGFGEGTDTIYIPGDPAGVEFKSGGLTFYNGNDTLALQGVTTTAKVNLYHERRKMLNKGVFIFDNEWYSVTDDDLSVKSGEEVYFVGPSAEPNYGVDFSNVSQDINVTLDTEYEIPNNTIWINNVYSIRGGAGLTTITGSANKDTILSGGGSMTVNAGAANDVISLTDSEGDDLIQYNFGDGNDYVSGFGENDSISIGGATYNSVTRGNDLILTVGVIGKITLAGAAGLSAPNIIGVYSSVTPDMSNEKTVYLNGGDSVATLTGANKRIVVGEEGATIAGYTLDKAFVVDASTTAALADQIDNETFTVDEGTFYANGQQPIVLNDVDTTNGTFVKFETADGVKNVFGWSPLAGGVLDGSSLDNKQILFGDSPNGKSTLRGGSKNDSIYAGGGDVVSLSGGQDKLHLSHKNGGGVTVDMGDGSTSARTEIVSGLSLAADVVKINSPNDIKFRVFDDKLAFDNVKSRVTFAELGSFKDANGLQIQSGEEIYTLRSNYDSGLANVDYLMQDSENRFFKVGTDFYIKDNGDNREYHLGDVGGTGKLTISDFTFGTDGDEIYLDSIDGLNGGGNDVYVVNGNNRVIVEGGAGKVMNINVAGHTYVAELGKELTYNDDVEYYGDLQGGTGCAISVGADYSGGEVAVYLNESTETNGKSKNYLGVNKVDASAYAGQASIIGGDLDDKIIGAQGATSMWGGDSGDDILFGTGSGNTFFYFRGNGNDQIRNAADGDVVNLGDITLADIISTEVMNTGAKFDFNDGGSLTVLNAGDVTYKLGDGSSWKANYSSREWEQQA